jgi:hypothetical protein
MQNKNIFFVFLSYNLPTGTLSSFLKIKFFAKIPYLSLMDPDPEGPKTCGSGSGSGSPTLPLGNHCIFLRLASGNIF